MCKCQKMHHVKTSIIPVELGDPSLIGKGPGSHVEGIPGSLFVTKKKKKSCHKTTNFINVKCMCSEVQKWSVENIMIPFLT